jgi:hypothetical protein
MPDPSKAQTTERVTLTTIEKPPGVKFRTIDLTLDGAQATIEVPEDAKAKDASLYDAVITGGDRFGLVIAKADKDGKRHSLKQMEDAIAGFPKGTGVHMVVDTESAKIAELHSAAFSPDKPYLRIISVERKVNDKTYSVGPELKPGMLPNQLTHDEALLILYCASTLKAKGS